MKVTNKQILSQDFAELGRIDLLRSFNIDSFTQDLAINDKAPTVYYLELREDELPKLFIKHNWINDSTLKVDISIQNENERIILETSLEINNIDKDTPDYKLKDAIAREIYDHIWDAKE